MNEEEIKKELLVEKPLEKDKFPILINRTMMSLRFTCKTAT